MPVAGIPEVGKDAGGKLADNELNNGGARTDHVAETGDSKHDVVNGNTDDQHSKNTSENGSSNNINETELNSLKSNHSTVCPSAANGNGEVGYDSSLSENNSTEKCNIVNETTLPETNDRELGVVEKSPLLKGDEKPEVSKTSGPSARKPELSRATSCYDNAPDGGWGWVVTFAAFMVGVILDGISFSFGIFYRELLLHFKESKSLTSWIISVLNGTYLGIGE